MDRWGPPWLEPFNIIKAKHGSDLNGTETCKRLKASFNKHRWGSPQPNLNGPHRKTYLFQKLANGLRLASINAVEVHSKQTSTDLNATQKHANGLRLPSINISTVCPNQASTNLCAPNSHTQDVGHTLHTMSQRTATQCLHQLLAPHTRSLHFLTVSTCTSGEPWAKMDTEAHVIMLISVLSMWDVWRMVNGPLWNLHLI